MTPGSARLTLPAQRAFVGVARLTVAGLAGRLGFDIDAAEDIKLAVAEAMNLLLRSGDGAPGAALAIDVAWDDSDLTIEVAGDGAGEPAAAEDLTVAVLVMEAVMDAVETADLEGDRPRVRLSRRRPADREAG